MKYRKLGNFGLKVNEIGLGTENLVKQPVEIITQTFQNPLSLKLLQRSSKPLEYLGK